MYLLDTNVVSELRRPRPHGSVVAWLHERQDDELFISAVTLGELQAGVEITRAQDPSRAAAIDQWIDQVTATHNVLAMDGPVFRLWARLMHGKSDTLIEDAMIASTAQVHGLTVVTRNVRYFVHFGVRTLDPFSR
ncbi:MAG: type II toxin-antitoxin system VapC family toxin [Proteobacteria bacterium]|nr:type II toxin-antitoxin system VapC family toxin [Pseudomonadota bacterium]MDA1057235.1 type II toxin-antitoxin system VapC family toxin [Pseudomonadota bacterium]